MNNQGVFLLRADQYQKDPSDWFVTPGIDITSLNSGSHPIRLIGSRGSGKTMILRSIAGKPFGESIPDNSAQANKRLRIYIRPDNQLMSAMKGWGVGQHIWKAASIELILFRIFEEATSKINHWLESKEENRLRFNSEKFTFDDNGEDLADWIRKRQHFLYKWARCPEGNPPIAIAFLSSLATLIKSLELFIDDFPKNISISVYIDEQETYEQYQQIIINDWIKNPPEGWVFHVAHRRYLDYVCETSTDEVIDPNNDFRIIDLDAPLISTDPESKKFREDFFKKLIAYEIRGLEINRTDFDLDNFSPESLLHDGKPNHATDLRKNSYAREAWRRLTKKSAKYTNFDPDDVIEKGNSLKNDHIWVLWPIIVARGKTNEIEQILDKPDYIRNHLNGAILQLYFESKGRAPMDFYSGFKALCSIVLSNVREFILILQLAIEYEYQKNSDKELLDILKEGISSKSQYKAILERSKHFNNVLAISAAERGHDIEKALYNWLTFFSTYQRLPTLPYNEPNHIICKDSIDESSHAWEIIKSGEKHGAFIFTFPSKQRESTKENQKDIKIHPLLAIKYYLSYHKRNTPSLSFKIIETITTANDIDQVKELIERPLKKTSNQYQKSLF